MSTWNGYVSDSPVVHRVYEKHRYTQRGSYRAVCGEEKWFSGIDRQVTCIVCIVTMNNAEWHDIHE